MTTRVSTRASTRASYGLVAVPNLRKRELQVAELRSNPRNVGQDLGMLENLNSSILGLSGSFCYVMGFARALLEIKNDTRAAITRILMKNPKLL